MNSDPVIFIALDGEQQGSFTTAELATLWEAGELGPGALYWHKGLPTWRPVAEYSPPSPEVGRTTAANIRVSTTAQIPGETIVRERGIVTAEVIEGVSVVSEFLAGWRNATGGRVSRLEPLLQRANQQALNPLKQHAATMGADAVVGVDLRVVQLGTSGSLMLGVNGTGTAVVLELRPPPLAV